MWCKIDFSFLLTAVQFLFCTYFSSKLPSSLRVHCCSFRHPFFKLIHFLFILFAILTLGKVKMVVQQLCTVELPIFCSMVYFVVSVLHRRL